MKRTGLTIITLACLLSMSISASDAASDKKKSGAKNATHSGYTTTSERPKNNGNFRAHCSKYPGSAGC